MSTPRIAIYAGTFDPITNGHLEILERACKIFDKVILVLAENPGKKHLFSLEERKTMIEEALVEWNLSDHACVDIFEGLAVEAAHKHGAIALVRGLRAVADFEFEFQMALMNHHLASDLQTVYLMPRADYTYLSSSLIKNVAQHGGEIEKFVPSGARRRLYQAFGIDHG